MSSVELRRLAPGEPHIGRLEMLDKGIPPPGEDPSNVAVHRVCSNVANLELHRENSIVIIAHVVEIPRGSYCHV